MRAFAEAYPDEQFVLRGVGQIPWGHNQSLLNKLNSPEQRLWYAPKTIEFGWSRNILDLQIDTNLFAHQGDAITNEMCVKCLVGEDLRWIHAQTIEQQ